MGIMLLHNTGMIYGGILRDSNWFALIFADLQRSHADSVIFTSNVRRRRERVGK